MVPFTYAVRPAGYDQLASLFWEQSKLTVMNGGIATINRVTRHTLFLMVCAAKKTTSMLVPCTRAWSARVHALG